MKKYIILAIMPLLFQSVSFAKDAYEDLDAMISNELRASQKAMRSSTKLELKSMLQALVSFGKKANNRINAINHIVMIQKALQLCKKEQYNPAWYDICGFFSVKPEIVIKQIDPALKEVDKALSDLKVTDSEYSVAFYAKVAVVGAVALLIGIFIRATYKKTSEESAEAAAAEKNRRQNEVGKTKNGDSQISLWNEEDFGYENPSLSLSQADLLPHRIRDLDSQISELEKKSRLLSYEKNRENLREAGQRIIDLIKLKNLKWDLDRQLVEAKRVIPMIE